MLDNILQHRILRHILYWVGIVVAYAIYAKGFGMAMYDSVIIKLCFLPGQILASYFLIYYQIPQLIYKKRYGLFSLTLLASIWFFPVLAHFADDYLVNFFLATSHPKQHPFLQIISEPILAYYQIAAFLIPSVTVAIKIVKDRFEEKQAMDALEQEKTHAELQLLKAKIHPHFLFETLEHLYKLSKEKSDLAPEVVVKLSEMLDYMLYQGQASKVSLAKEVDLLQHYLDLQKLRYGKGFIPKFERQLEYPDAEIVPLILLSVLESALKHTIASQEGSIQIRLSLTSSTEWIRFNIVISKREEGQKGNLPELSRQLELSYPDTHIFDIFHQNQQTHYQLTLFSPPIF